MGKGAGVATILDYVRDERATFGETPLREADSLVFSQLAMVRMGNVAPLHLPEEGGRHRLRRMLERFSACRRLLRRHAAKRTPEGCSFADLFGAGLSDDKFTGLASVNVQELLAAAAESPRFGGVVIHDYVSVFSEQRRTQFAAVAFTCPESFTYLAFRGTDDSWTGWREDFDMAYAAPVPAQEMAARYAAEMARRTGRPLILGGHSKGGNLAMYAAAKLPEREARQLLAVFDHDGPGFAEGVLSVDERARVDTLVRKTVPRESLVGVLMASPAGFRVVESAGRGIEQHSVFRWQLEDGTLVEAEDLAASARFVADVLNEWIGGLGRQERRIAVDALFEALRASGATDMFEVLSGGPKTIGLLVGAARRTPPRARGVIVDQLKRLSGIAARRARAVGIAYFTSG